MSPIPPYTASTTLQFSHAGGSQVIFSDPPQLFNRYAAKDNAELITAAWRASSTAPWAYDNSFIVSSTSQQMVPASWVYGNMVNTSETQTINGAKTLTATTTASFCILGAAAYDCVTTSSNTQYCQKAYIDGVAVAGASNANKTTKGIVEQATVAEISAGTATGGTGAVLFISPDAYAASSLASTTLTVSTTSQQSLATSTVTLTSHLSNKDYIEVMFTASSSSNGQLIMWLNGDTTSANYSSQIIQFDDGVDEIVAGDTWMTLDSDAQKSSRSGFMRIRNISGSWKTGDVTIVSYATTTGAVANSSMSTFVWKSVDKITSISFGIRQGAGVGGTLSASTTIRVTGY
jgi:hypothetical protein